MSQMFRCPGCKEVIRTGKPVCQYCSFSIDGPTAHAEALKFQAGIDACASANHIKSLNYAAPLLLLIDIALPFLGSTDNPFMSPRMPLYASILPLGALVAVVQWLTKYGALQTDDTDFPDAKRAVKKALILWLILSGIHLAILAKTF
jgi:hypothetical protein